MDNSFSSLIDSASGVLILLPTKPYFDQVAAGLALYLSLKGSKEVSIMCPSPMLVEFNRLVGVNQIVSEAGNKNLTIKFTGYPAENVERVSADVEGGKFYLTVIPKPGKISPKKEEIELSYSGVSADTVILIGGGNESHFPILEKKDAQGGKIVHIGTRELSVSPDRGVMSLARPAASVSEIMTSLIKESGLTLDSDTATNLILGIEEGSNHFASEEVTAETFELFAHLLRAGGKRFAKSPALKGFYPPGSIPGVGFKFGQKPSPQAQTTRNESAEEDAVQENSRETPQDWLEPKIYKGTSV